MRKKILTLFITVTLLVSVIHIPSLANIQIALSKVTISEVFYVESQDAITGKPLIRPTMTVGWEKPIKWADNPDPTKVHEPDYYEIVANNLTRGTTITTRVDEGSQEVTNRLVELNEKMILDTGSLYSIEVKPYHLHLMASGEGYELAPSSGIAASAYAITDLNVDFETTESSIQVIWDDLGVAEFKYNIVYAIGDYTTKSTQVLRDNKEGEITSLTSDSATVQKFYDPVSRRNKLSYTIKENINPGQIYSVLVDPTVDSFNNKDVMRNRNYPVIRSCSTNIELDLFEEGDFLRLEWNIPASFKVAQVAEAYELVEATLIQIRDGQNSNVVIFDGNAAIIGYYKVPKPTTETSYQIKFSYAAGGDKSELLEPAPISNITTYVPSELRITPTKPRVPSVMSEKILNDLLNHQNPKYTPQEIRKILEQKYFVTGYTYSGDLKTLLGQNNTYHLLDNNGGINLVWEAFSRIDVDLNSPTYTQYIYDSNVYYDIWVTESLEAMNVFAKKVVTDQRYGSLTPTNNITDGTKIFGYSQELGYYYNDSTGELEPIIPGKLYYIKIVAKKKIGNGELISEPTTLALYYGYDGDAFEPPVIAKPPLAIKESETTSTGITINWKETWTEIISPDALEDEALAVWQNEVWVSPTGDISDTVVPGATHYPIYQGAEIVTKLRDDLRAMGISTIIISREVDLGRNAEGNPDVKYKFKRIPYAQVLSAIAAKNAEYEDDAEYDFTKYYEDLIKADKEGTTPLGWVDILPLGETSDPNILRYREDALLPNTTYLFMVYPYREGIDGQVLFAHYPSPIVASTKATEVEVNPDPTVPNLYIDDVTDSTITLTWKYNLDFKYELVYSTFEDITKAKPVIWNLPASKLDPNYPTNGKDYPVVVTDLFPNTEYYFWIRAIQPATSTTSRWSNAVLQKTRDVSNPFPPKGFGIASLESMKLYKFDKSVTDDYIAVEWLLDTRDLPPETDKNVKKLYSYILEVSDNPKFIDPIYIESAGGTGNVAPSQVEFLQKNLIKINELIPNRSYYMRVKTRHKVVGKEQGQLITKDSVGYSPTIKIITVSIGDEYDGIIDRDLEILPSENYEIIYNKYNDILEFRFRDNGKGQDGASDNNVDQRLISSLISQNTYVYDIDVSSYGKEPIIKRIISIPFSIIEAFNTHKVDMVIDAGDMVLTVPYGSIVAKINEQVKQYGVAPDVKIQIETLSKTYLTQQMVGQSIRPIAAALDVGISIKSDQLYQSLKYTDKEMEVKLLVNNKFEQFRVNRLGAVKDVQSKWVTVPSEFNDATGYMSFKTAKVGAYSGYVLENVKLTSDQEHWSKSYRDDVMLNYKIQGLGAYNPYAKVPEAQMINIIYPLVQGKDAINLNDAVTKQMMTDLKYAKIKTNDSSTKNQMTREEAISMFVRAYELMNETTIQASANQINAANSNTAISSLYKTALAKAATLGMVGQINQSRPKEDLTYGELFALWSKLNK